MNAVARSERWAIVVVVAVALAARLAALPFATSDGGDTPARIWGGLSWLSEPRVFKSGVWGPLHLYLIGLSLSIVRDPVHTPVVMSVLFGVASAALLYLFVRLEFADLRVALLVGLTYAIYPMAIRNSVSVRSETPCVFFLLLSVLAVARARSEGGSWRHAVAGGVTLTLASALRYEAWVLIPLLTLLLWRRRALMLTFAACALIHPVIWMYGSWVERGDPFFGMSWAAQWELQSMGRSQIHRTRLLRLAATYPLVVLQAMSPLIGLICAGGAVLALVGRRRSAVWLIPGLGVLGFWCLGVARGALVPKLNYTEIGGTLLFPFSALVYERVGVGRWTAARFSLAAVALPAVSLLLCCVPCLERAGLGRFAVRFAGPSPIPRIENQDLALPFARTLRDSLRGEDAALLSDFYGWGATPYVALLTGLPRKQILMARGAPNLVLRSDSVATFLRKHPRGVLIVLSDSRFAHEIGVGPASTSASIGGVEVALEQFRSVAWPGDPGGTLTAFRYVAASTVPAGP
jgi:hypothetical protein